MTPNPVVGCSFFLWDKAAGMWLIFDNSVNHIKRPTGELGRGPILGQIQQRFSQLSNAQSAITPANTFLVVRLSA